MADDTGDKTEEPTSKRLEDARKKGQVPRSRELNTFVTLMAGSVMLLVMGQHIVHGLWLIMREQFQLSREVIFDPASPVIYFEKVISDGLILILPFVLVLLVATLLTPMMMGGWNFSMEAMQPKLSKFNPLTGLKRMFGLQGLVELIKAILKVVLVLFVGYLLFKFYIDSFLALSTKAVTQAMAEAGDKLSVSLFLLSASLLILVLIDVPYQLWNHTRQLKMTKQEVKDEHKDSEGNPEVKGRIRRLQMEAAQQRMMEQVPKADVIVTNPTHFAVALKYDQHGSSAPILVAKGVDLMAAHIRTIATGADVPLVAAPPLARALYYSTELDQEIPQGLFLAVAQVLAYVFQLKTAQEKGWAAPKPPADLPVPEELLDQ